MCAHTDTGCGLSGIGEAATESPLGDLSPGATGALVVGVGGAARRDALLHSVIVIVDGGHRCRFSSRTGRQGVSVARCVPCYAAASVKIHVVTRRSSWMWVCRGDCDNTGLLTYWSTCWTDNQPV